MRVSALFRGDATGRLTAYIGVMAAAPIVAGICRKITHCAREKGGERRRSSEEMSVLVDPPANGDPKATDLLVKSPCAPEYWPQ
jgi:hypothetical protein